MQIEGRHHGQPGGTRAGIAALLRRSSRALTTPEITARLALGRSAAFHHLVALEAAGLVERTGGGGRSRHAWRWRGARDEAAD